MIVPSPASFALVVRLGLRPLVLLLWNLLLYHVASNIARPAHHSSTAYHIDDERYNTARMDDQQFAHPLNHVLVPCEGSGAVTVTHSQRHKEIVI
jgi:hypothetical protein